MVSTKAMFFTTELWRKSEEGFNLGKSSSPIKTTKAVSRRGAGSAEETGKLGQGLVVIKAMFFTTRSSLTTWM